MYRCMTCDVKQKGEPTMVALNKDESVGLCPKCVTIVRSFNTLVAMANGEYGEKKCGENICCDDPDCPDKDGFSCTEGEREKKGD